ncbi:MgtC/SapB family protein [Alkalibacterium olivapovliticus]|uniref:Putative Mg2+ transporter-C (MgtC) family protein n=1 Tax=Alkalibacterium olivapovliticus TaxID=99907 RepID=A0A2T0W8D3_9LACT|nr:MgtC/SapB family protein [Alkalibacterium olivapovliticus]PRY82971.1 putative Mg2+ transporter-C (MgtC) family protein [Alkalibacterium olivapovliticus]
MAVVVGGIIGLERDLKNHAAGFRTYILVCLGSTMVMMTNQFIFENYGLGDPARMGAQVISGIGFLGAGTIIVTNNNHVRGLTTAAGLWSAACIGLAIGIGFYEGALAGGFTLLVIMTLFQKFKNKYVNRNKKVECLILFETFNDLNAFTSKCSKNGWKILSIQSKYYEQKDATLYMIAFDITTSLEINDLVEQLNKIKGLQSIDIQ